MALSRIGTPALTGPLVGQPAAEPAAGPDGAGFDKVVERLIGGVEAAGADANTAVTEMLSGTGEVHDAMIALQRAELSLQLTVQVRNKLIQAYNDIMRMPV